MFEELLDSVVGGAGWGVGLGLGVGAALWASRGILRPAAKAAIKGYMNVSEKAKGATSGLSNEMQSLYQEAQAERQTAQSSQASRESSQVPIETVSAGQA